MPSRTRFPELFGGLADPFDKSEVKVRSQAGRQLHYVTVRTVENRLDEVLGPENWWDEYVPGENSVLCKLSLRLPDGSVVTKADAGGYAGMADSGDDDKSGYSDALKRAAARWGVGRYLYRDGVPCYSTETKDDGEPEAASCSKTHDSRPAYRAPAESAQKPKAAYEGGPPRNGRALFAWTKDQEERHEVGLLKYLNQWGKLQDFPGRMVEWDGDQVNAAYAEASRKLASIGQGQATAEAEPADTNAKTTAQRQDGSAPPVPGPDNPIRRPATGKDLWNSCKDHQQDQGVTIIGPTVEWARVNGIPGKMADWTGGDLERAWCYAASLAARHVAPAVDRTPTDRATQLRRSLYSKARHHLRLEYKIPPEGKVAPDQILVEINRIHSDMFGGEEIVELEKYDDIGRMESVEAALAELIEEHSHVSS